MVSCLPGRKEKPIYFHGITLSRYAIDVANAIIVNFVYAID